MYLFELIVKWINPNKKYESKNQYNPFEEDKPDFEKCEHMFLPVDTTGEVLACNKCGLLINKNEIKKRE